jgi:hypothetical protein
VAALRKEASAGSSPDSSPQGNRAADKKKSKKKRKKSDRFTNGTSLSSPYIKPEPRSPSPASAPTYGRPNKRQRQSQRQQDGLDYDEPRYAQRVPPGDAYQEHVPSRSYRDDATLAHYDKETLNRQPQPLLGPPRLERDLYQESHRASGAYAPEYPPGAVRIVRSVSQAGLERSYREAPNRFIETEDVLGRSVRQPGTHQRPGSPKIYERLPSGMPPPRPPTTRIYVDEFGREYIEPHRPAVRQSVAPIARPPGEELVFDRAIPSRAESRRPDAFEDNHRLYQHSSPSYAAQRRVVTQPELTGPDIRYRERDFPPRPVAPPNDEYVPSRSRPIRDPPVEYLTRPASSLRVGEAARYDFSGGYEGRSGAEPPREFSTRAASARPVDTGRYDTFQAYERQPADYVSVRASTVRPVEPTHYGVARPYGASVRRELPDREYAASVHPETRHDLLPPEGRAYSVRPVERVIRQEYGFRPADGFYERQPLRGDEEILYVNPVARPDRRYHQGQGSHQYESDR